RSKRYWSSDLFSSYLIESFFYGILEEVDLNDDFKDSDAVTFQVMPKNNGLVLFISKGANVDEDIINSIARESKQLSSNEKKKSRTEEQREGKKGKSKK